MDENEIILLVEQAQSGDREAFGQLVREFETSVFAVVLRRLRNHAEAHEVTQNVFMQALRKLSQLRDAARFGAWLRRIAVRMSINHALRRPRETAWSPDSFKPTGPPADNPLEHLLKNERAGRLRGGLSRLRELDRKTLVAFYFEGRSLKEMSDAFDSPIGTIKRRLHTARNRLRE